MLSLTPYPTCSHDSFQEFLMYAYHKLWWISHCMNYYTIEVFFTSKIVENHFNFFIVPHLFAVYIKLYIVFSIDIYTYFTNIFQNLKQNCKIILETFWHSVSRDNVLCWLKASPTWVWINLCHLLGVRPGTIICLCLRSSHL